jgi:hypothetical protein
MFLTQADLSRKTPITPPIPPRINTSIFLTLIPSPILTIIPGISIRPVRRLSPQRTPELQIDGTLAVDASAVGETWQELRILVRR